MKQTIGAILLLILISVEGIYSQDQYNWNSKCPIVCMAAGGFNCRINSKKTVCCNKKLFCQRNFFFKKPQCNILKMNKQLVRHNCGKVYKGGCIHKSIKYTCNIHTIHGKKAIARCASNINRACKKLTAGYLKKIGKNSSTFVCKYFVCAM